MKEMKSRRYLLVIRYAADAQDRARIVSSGRDIKELVERMSAGECKLAWTSTDGASFAFLLRSDRDARWIHQEILTPGQHGPLHGFNPHESGAAQTSPMRSGDSILVVEIGEDFHGSGFSNAWTWLQHH